MTIARIDDALQGAKAGVPVAPMPAGTPAECARGGLYAWEFQKGKRRLNVHVEGQLALNHPDAMLYAALAGACLAYVPEDAATPYLEDGRLEQVLRDWCPPYPGFHLYYPNRRQASPAFALLVDALRYPHPQG